MRRSDFCKGMATLAAALIALSVVSSSAAAKPTPPADDTVYFIAVAPLGALPATFDVADIPALDARPDIAITIAGSATLVAPMTATPSGYVLTNPGNRANDYTYNSSEMAFNTGPCNPNCTPTETVKTSMYQYVFGTNSKSWTIRANATTFLHTGSITWSSSALYYCGINISGATDKICEGGGASPSGVALTRNVNATKSFGAQDGKVVFPMVSISIYFSNGVSGTWKYRGWDTNVSSNNTKLAANSDTGA